MGSCHMWHDSYNMWLAPAHQTRGKQIHVSHLTDVFETTRFTHTHTHTHTHAHIHTHTHTVPHLTDVLETTCFRCTHTHTHTHAHIHTHTHTHTHAHTHTHTHTHCYVWYESYLDDMHHIRWLRSVGSFKLYVSFAKDTYKRDDILQKRRIIIWSLLIVATPYESYLDEALSRVHLSDFHVWDTNPTWTGLAFPLSRVHLRESHVCYMTRLHWCAGHDSPTTLARRCFVCTSVSFTLVIWILLGRHWQRRCIVCTSVSLTCVVWLVFIDV